MNDPVQKESQHVALSPIAMAVAAVLVGAPGVGSLIQSSKTNSALTQIENTLMTDLQARQYLEDTAKVIARQSERLGNLSKQVVHLEKEFHLLETKFSIKYQEGLSSITGRMDRMGLRITKIGEIVAARLNVGPQMTPRTTPYYPNVTIPQQLFFENTDKLIRVSLHNGR